MSSSAFVAFCAQILLVQFACGQVINRSCGCSSSLGVPETYFPGNVFTGPSIYPGPFLPGQVLSNPTILPNGVIQSQSVANDLANTLQLLTVSSLLSNKLPLNGCNGFPVVGGCGLPIGGLPIGGLPIGGLPIGGFPIGGLPIGGCGSSFGYV